MDLEKKKREQLQIELRNPRGKMFRVSLRFANEASTLSQAEASRIALL